MSSAIVPAMRKTIPFLFIIFLALPLFFPGGAAALELTLKDYGTFEPASAPGREPRHLESTSEVPAKAGLAFGLLIVPRGGEGDMAQLVVRIRHPALANPSLGGVSRLDQWLVRVPMDKPFLAGWAFDQPWKIKPGAWRVELIHAGAVVMGRDFRVETPETLQAEAEEKDGKSEPAAQEPAPETPEETTESAEAARPELAPPAPASAEGEGTARPQAPGTVTEEVEVEPPEAPSSAAYCVQVGSFKNEQNALREVKRLKKLGFKGCVFTLESVRSTSDWHMVSAGCGYDLGEMQELVAKYRSGHKGSKAFLNLLDEQRMADRSECLVESAK